MCVAGKYVGNAVLVIVMDQQYLIINEKSVRQTAEAYFREDSEDGIEAGLAFREHILDSVKIKSIFGWTDFFVRDEDTLTIENITFQCDAFREMDFDIVKKIYVFLVTSGEYGMSPGAQRQFFYEDAWGTAYVRAASDFIQRMIREQEPEGYVSDFFGPGSCGMPQEEIKKVFSLLEGKNVGISYNESGIMIPIKTLAGLYFVGTEEMRATKAKSI